MIYVASFLLSLGILQFISVYFHLRGASLTGVLTGPSILIAFALIINGAWFLIDEPAIVIVLNLLIAIPLAWIALVLAGIITNLGWNPAKAHISELLHSGVQISQVKLPVVLTHVKPDDAASHMMPCTAMFPVGWGNKSRNDDGKIILVVCGAGDTRMTFKWHLFDSLLSRNIAVVTIDPPGHGEFQNVPMTISNGHSAIDAAVRWITEYPGTKSIGACGISFGGNLLISYASIHEQIKCLSTISTPVRLQQVTRKTMFREVLYLLMLPKNIGLLREGSLLTLFHEYRSLKGAWFGEDLIGMIDKLDALGGIQLIQERPKLIVHGTADSAVPVINARNLFQQTESSSTIMLIPQATHVSPVLFKTYMDAMADWFHGMLDYNPTDA